MCVTMKRKRNAMKKTPLDVLAKRIADDPAYQPTIPLMRIIKEECFSDLNIHSSVIAGPKIQDEMDGNTRQDTAIDDLSFIKEETESEFEDASETELELDEHDPEGTSFLVSDGHHFKHIFKVEATEDNVKADTNHEAIVEDKSSLECLICNKKFVRSCDLKRHMSVHSVEKLRQCNLCNRKFKFHCDLRRHLVIHSGEMPHECTVCHQKFTRAGGLKKHFRIHTGEKPYECSICRRKFTRSDLLKNHESSHSRLKILKCSECNTPHKSTVSLDSHYLHHKGEKSYGCSLCSKTFFFKSCLKTHMRSHKFENPLKNEKQMLEDEKLLQCSICKKKFNSSHRLRRHQLIHFGVKRHECSNCDKKFVRLDHLTEHMQIHSKQKTRTSKKRTKDKSRSDTTKTIVSSALECPLCNETFLEYDDLKTHVVIHL